METPIEYQIGLLKGMSKCISVMNELVNTIVSKPMKTFEMQFLISESANAMMDMYDEVALSINTTKKGE